MNALGLYLLISLFFVVGTLLELAIVLEVRRGADKKKKKNKVQANEQTIKVKSLDQKDLEPDLDTIKLKTEKIDRIAFMTCLILYFSFNVIYWAYFLA